LHVRKAQRARPLERARIGVASASRADETYEEARRAFERVWRADLRVRHHGDFATQAAGLDEARLGEMIAEAGIARQRG
jgi:hypothetical protein